jgi:hypothetical protein
MTHWIDVRLFLPHLFLALAALLVAGCVTVHEGKLDQARFPRSQASANSGTNARIVVVPDVEQKQYTYERKEGLSYTYRLVIPIGQIVEAAAIAALSDEFGRSIEQYRSFEAATEGNAPAALSIMIATRPVEFGLHDESFPLLIPLFPVVVPIPTRQDARLVVDWQVLDADRNVLWTRRYDSGDVKLTYGRPGDRDLTQGDLFVRLAHELAYTLMRQAAQDLRSWLEAERLRERVL